MLSEEPPCAVEACRSMQMNARETALNTLGETSSFHEELFRACLHLGMQGIIHPPNHGANHEDAEEIRAPDKVMRLLRLAFYLAQEVGARLGSGQILFGTMSAPGAAGRDGPWLAFHVVRMECGEYMDATAELANSSVCTYFSAHTCPLCPSRSPRPSTMAR